MPVNKRSKPWLLAAVLLPVASAWGQSAGDEPRFGIGLETGAVGFSKNDVQIPNDTGTRFDMTGLTGSGPEFFARLQGHWNINEKHGLRVVLAPLEVSGTGELEADTDFAGETFPVPLRAEDDFLPILETIPQDVLERAAVLWLNYPNNPTGATAPLSFYQHAVDFARRHGLLICHDAPYADVTYDGYVAPSILEVEGAMDVALEFNSLSKSHNMAGWRIGMAVGNAQAVGDLALVKTYR